MAQYQEFRQRYPRFLYQSAHWSVVNAELQLQWEFSIGEDMQFHPSMSVPLPENWQSRVSETLLDRVVLAIGMVELLSYWKTTASPNIVIEAGYLSSEELRWWRQLLIKGMGEYFYVNQIDFTAEDFVSLSCPVPPPSAQPEAANDSTQSEPSPKRIMVPIGGGKDSIVTLESLRQWQQHAPQTERDSLITFAINPTAASKAVIEQSGLPTLTVQRTLDPLLFELNSKGFLNGHTPFSSLVSFTSLLVAALHGYDTIALGNEQSANEGNVDYLGQTINHQYSKSFEYETAFRHFVTELLQPYSTQPLPNYFSLLRPFNELQIAQKFASMGEAYFSLFRSCNRGQKTNSWCGQCAKCLFAYAILFPFLGEQQMTSIFSHNLFEDQSLLPIALELTGIKRTKPFDCVGTYDESKAAFYLSYHWYLGKQKEVPPLLESLMTELDQQPALQHLSEKLLSQFNQQHHVPAELIGQLQAPS